VREVVGFKSDHFSIDEVCLGFRIEEAGSPVRIWVDEDDRGFKQFLPEVEKRFNIDPEWFAKVAYPAFVQNWTTLWKHV